MSELNLEQYDEEFEAAQIDPNEYSDPPDGKYNVVVEKVEFAKSKQSGTPMLKWQLRITGPTHAGCMLFRNNMIASKDNVKWLKNDLAKCGLDVTGIRLSQLESHLDKLLDVRLDAQKKTNGEYVNVYINKRIDGNVTDNSDLPF